MTHRMWTIFQPASGTRYHCDCCSCIPTNTVMEATCRFGCEDISDAEVFVLMLADKWVWKFPGEAYL
jgi:hypothetical protein